MILLFVLSPTHYQSNALFLDLLRQIPLHIALKSCCKPEVIETLIGHFPGSCIIMDGEGRSPLSLALSSSADDMTSLALINHAPHVSYFVFVDFSVENPTCSFG